MYRGGGVGALRPPLCTHTVGTYTMNPLLLALAIAPCVALLVGLCVGWVLGRRAGAHAHALYVEAHEKAQAHELDRVRSSGGPCWVKSQIGLPLATPPDPTQGPP